MKRHIQNTHLNLPLHIAGFFMPVLLFFIGFLATKRNNTLVINWYKMTYVNRKAKNMGTKPPILGTKFVLKEQFTHVFATQLLPRQIRGLNKKHDKGTNRS